MQPKFKVGELCGFNADEAQVQMPDKLVVLNLRHAVGRIEKFLGYGYEVYIRYKGDDYLLCFPECMLHEVEDTYLNRIKVSHQSEIVATDTGMYYKFGDGSMYGMDGKPFVPFCICLDPEYRGKIVFKKKESKMTKDRCIKLLESYRAEREKVAKGRKFERCLRADVVNEAIEKAIELLKNG